jgi:hypothetical protein
MRFNGQINTFSSLENACNGFVSGSRTPAASATVHSNFSLSGLQGPWHVMNISAKDLSFVHGVKAISFRQPVLYRSARCEPNRPHGTVTRLEPH